MDSFAKEFCQTLQTLIKKVFAFLIKNKFKVAVASTEKFITCEKNEFQNFSSETIINLLYLESYCCHTSICKIVVDPHEQNNLNNIWLYKDCITIMERNLKICVALIRNYIQNQQILNNLKFEIGFYHQQKRAFQINDQINQKSFSQFLETALWLAKDLALLHNFNKNCKEKSFYLTQIVNFLKETENYSQNSKIKYRIYELEIKCVHFVCLFRSKEYEEGSKYCNKAVVQIFELISLLGNRIYKKLQIKHCKALNKCLKLLLMSLLYQQFFHIMCNENHFIESLNSILREVENFSAPRRLLKYYQSHGEIKGLIEKMMKEHEDLSLLIGTGELFSINSLKYTIENHYRESHYKFEPEEKHFDFNHEENYKFVDHFAHPKIPTKKIIDQGQYEISRKYLRSEYSNEVVTTINTQRKEAGSLDFANQKHNKTNFNSSTNENSEENLCNPFLQNDKIEKSAESRVDIDFELKKIQNSSSLRKLSQNQYQHCQRTSRKKKTKEEKLNYKETIKSLHYKSHSSVFSYLLNKNEPHEIEGNVKSKAREVKLELEKKRTIEKFSFGFEEKEINSSKPKTAWDNFKRSTKEKEFFDNCKEREGKERKISEFNPFKNFTMIDKFYKLLSQNKSLLSIRTFSYKTEIYLKRKETQTILDHEKSEEMLRNYEMFSKNVKLGSEKHFADTMCSSKLSNKEKIHNSEDSKQNKVFIRSINSENLIRINMKFDSKQLRNIEKSRKLKNVFQIEEKQKGSSEREKKYKENYFISDRNEHFEKFVSSREISTTTFSPQTSRYKSRYDNSGREEPIIPEGMSEEEFKKKVQECYRKSYESVEKATKKINVENGQLNNSSKAKKGKGKCLRRSQCYFGKIE